MNSIIATARSALPIDKFAGNWEFFSNSGKNLGIGNCIATKNDSLTCILNKYATITIWDGASSFTVQGSSETIGKYDGNSTIKWTGALKGYVWSYLGFLGKGTYTQCGVSFQSA